MKKIGLILASLFVGLCIQGQISKGKFLKADGELIEMRKLMANEDKVAADVHEPYLSLRESETPPPTPGDLSTHPKYVRLYEAGTLKEVLGEEAELVDSLIIEGPLNKEDCELMWSLCAFGQLVDINMAKAQFNNNKLPDRAFYNPEEQFPTTSNILDIRIVILPDDLEIIGTEAFKSTGLQTINLPESLNSIEDYAFAFCSYTKMDEVVLPDGIENISRFCFAGFGVPKIVLPSAVKNIAEYAFQWAKVEEFVFPENLESIGNSAFSGCKSLKEIDLPDNCSRIGQFAFYQCIAAEKVKMPKKLQYIDFNSFSCLFRVKEVILPEELVAIGKEGLAAAYELRSLDLPEGIREMRECAIEDNNIEVLVLPVSFRSFGEQSCYSFFRSLKRIISKSPVPPHNNWYEMNNADVAPYSDRSEGSTYIKPFDDWVKDVPVYVPVGAKERYKATWWGEHFSNIIETEDFEMAAVGAVSADAEGARASGMRGEIRIMGTSVGTAYAVFGIDGRQVAAGCAVGEESVAVPAGIYVVRLDRKSVKVCVR